MINIVTWGCGGDKGQLSILFMDMIVTFFDFKAHKNQLLY